MDFSVLISAGIRPLGLARLGLALLSVGPACGQALLSDKEALTAVAEKTARRKAALLLDAPTTSASLTSVASPFTQLALTAASGSQEASARLAWPFLKQHLLLAAALKQTFSEQPKRSTPLSLDGLNQGASATFSLQYNGPSKLTKSAQANINTPAKSQTVLEAVRQRIAKRKDLMGPDNATFSPTEKANPATIPLSRMVDFLSANDMEKLENEGLFQTSPWLYGATASFGKVQYDYIADASAQAPASLVGLNHNFRGYAGLALSKTGVLALSYTLQRQYRTVADDPISFSYPLSATAGTLATKDVYLGTPTQATTSRFSLEYRVLVNTIGSVRRPFLGINPAINLVTNTQKLAFNVAFYFLNEVKPLDSEPYEAKKQGVQGGVALGYLTGKGFDFQPLAKGVSAEVFISVPFDLFGFAD